MLFSIIVPIYNVEKYLERCVTSLINQTYKDIEIILVDDESLDKCPEMCDVYAKKDNRIRVIHKKNGGLSDARNAGLKIATGEYVIFVDSDDYVELTMCEDLYPYTKEKYQIIMGDAIVEGGKLDLSHIKESKVLSGKEYLLEAYRQNKAPMAAWLNIFNREYLVKNNVWFKYGILHEDEEFTPRALLKAQSIFCTGIAFYHYILRDNSITTKKDKRKNAIDLFDTCCELEKVYEDIENKELKDFLLDSLVVKYLSLFQAGALHKYGNKYLHKEFIKKNALKKRTKKKAILYCLSPRLYYWINENSKKILGRKQ